MSNNRPRTIADYLYEKPGPKTRKKIAVATVISLVLLAFLIYEVVNRFYVSGQLDAKYWSLFAKGTTWKYLLKGFFGTIKVGLVASIISFCLGMLYMLGRVSGNKILGAIATVFVEICRGTPTLLFIYFFFLLAPQYGLKLPAFWKITLPVAISASGVVAEVLRSGVKAVPNGQREAALSLGMSRVSTFFKIIFPQGFRYVIPALISEIVIVLKDTTFAYVVNYGDLMQNAKVLITNYDALLSVYLVAAIIYILINYILNKVSVYIAHRTGSKAIT